MYFFGKSDGTWLFWEKSGGILISPILINVITDNANIVNTLITS